MARPTIIDNPPEKVARFALQGMPYISNLMDVFLQERGYVTGHRSSRINDCFHTEETVKQL